MPDAVDISAQTDYHLRRKELKTVNVLSESFDPRLTGKTLPDVFF
jgi:hypothetical protein